MVYCAWTQENTQRDKSVQYHNIFTHVAIIQSHLLSVVTYWLAENAAKYESVSETSELSNGISKQVVFILSQHFTTHQQPYEVIQCILYPQPAST